MYYLCTTRFSNETYEQNKRFCKLNNLKCYYSNPTSIPKIPNESIIFMLELNINENKIMGIGRIRKDPIYNNINVYKDGTYNSICNFIGDEYIESINIEEEEWYNKISEICFIGRGHLKRGNAISRFPIEKLKEIDIIKILCEKFNKKIK
jgi:hypothetical protein